VKLSNLKIDYINLLNKFDKLEFKYDNLKQEYEAVYNLGNQNEAEKEDRWKEPQENKQEMQRKQVRFQA